MGTEIDALLRAIFYTQTAFDTGDLAGFNNSLLDWVTVGAQNYRPFLIFGYALQKALGALVNTHTAA
jgi:hypothetical protein